jgi:hypothetical protein
LTALEIYIEGVAEEGAFTDGCSSPWMGKVLDSGSGRVTETDAGASALGSMAVEPKDGLPLLVSTLYAYTIILSYNSQVESRVV